MADETKVFRCSKCNKVLFEGKLVDGIIKKKCKCGTMNTFAAEPGSKPFVHNQPYQNRMDLIKK